MEIMARPISTERKEKNRLDKAKQIRELLGAKALAAERPPKKDDKPKADKPPKGNNENAAPVLAKPNPKAHAEKGKGRERVERGKKKGREIRLSEGWLS